MYKVKEIYYTIQGEGFHSGRPALFCRMAGCNLWTGREEDRDKAICKFCDTDFWGIDGVNGGSYTAESLVQKLIDLFPSEDHRFVVITGGEPALQIDVELINALHQARFEIAIETNGTIKLPKGIDWICVSPKADTEIVVTSGDELKLVYPQAENIPEMYQDMDFKHHYLQPLQDEDWQVHTKASVAYCKAHPKWKLSVQTHKYLDIP